jgi:hypothetical protein
MLKVSIKQSQDFVLNRLWALVGSSKPAGRPALEDILEITLNIPLEPGEHAKDFVVRYRRLTQSVAQQQRRRLE